MIARRHTNEADPAFEKYLSDNRDRYIEQSKQTKGGVVAYLPKRVSHTYTAQQSPLTPEEESDGRETKYGSAHTA